MKAARRSGIVGIALGIGALISACGGDSPEAVEGALEEALPTLAFVDETESPCAATAILQTVGFEQLALAGHTSQTITASPTEAIADIIDSQDSPALREGVTDCLDVNSMVRSELVAINDGSDLACDSQFAVGTPIVDDYLESYFDGTPVQLNIADTDENRDLLRACVTNDVFAETFGIDTHDALVLAVEATLDNTIRDDDQPCVAPLLIDHFGSAEATNEAGISTESPTFDIDELDFDSGDEDAFLSAVATCSSLGERQVEIERIAEPSFVDCLASSFETNDLWQRSAVEVALGDSAASRTVDRQRNGALSDCANAHMAAVHGVLSARDQQAAIDAAEIMHAEAVHYDPGLEQYGRTEAELRCSAVTVVRDVDIERLGQLSLSEDPERPSQESLDLRFALFEAVAAGNRMCSVDDLHYLAPDIVRAGFASETLACIREDVGDMTAFVEATDRLTLSRSIEEHYEALDEVTAHYSRLQESVEVCISEDEEDAFDDWLDWLNADSFDGVVSGEPSSVST